LKWKQGKVPLNIFSEGISSTRGEDLNFPDMGLQLTAALRQPRLHEVTLPGSERLGLRDFKR
jgi:hypothetical protein